MMDRQHVKTINKNFPKEQKEKQWKLFIKQELIKLNHDEKKNTFLSKS